MTAYRGPWVVIGLAALVLAWLWLGWSGEAVALQRDAAATALAQLGTLLVLALFVERLLEVFISVWREERRRQLADVAEAREAAGEADGARDEIARFQGETQRVALLGGLLLGVLIALAGVRILGAVIEEIPADAPAAQLLLLHAIDVLVTGGLIGGGADALHKLMNVLTKFLEETRRSLARGGEGRQSGEGS